MSVAIQLVDEAVKCGIRLTVIDGAIQCTSKHPLPGEIITKIRNHKPEIIKLLSRKTPVQTVEQYHNKSWITNHETDLRKAGFTERDIYGNGTWFLGIADLSIWQKENLRVKLIGDELCFTFHNGHMDITQKCRPEPRGSRA